MYKVDFCLTYKVSEDEADSPEEAEDVAEELFAEDLRCPPSDLALFGVNVTKIEE